jgi:hypothetical protein
VIQRRDSYSVRAEGEATPKPTLSKIIKKRGTDFVITEGQDASKSATRRCADAQRHGPVGVLGR